MTKRRDIAATLRETTKDLLPVMDAEAVAGLWKDRPLPDAAERLRTAKGWVEVHRGIKTAALGVRRPHPGVPQDPPRSDGRGPLASRHAASRLGHRRRPGTAYRPLPGAATG